MATDFGPASNNGELYLSTNSSSQGVFIEQHVQGPVTSAITSGTPGGLSGAASGLNNINPTGFSTFTSATAYGTVSNGGAVTPTFIAGYIGGTANPLPAALFAFKNPG